MSTTFTRGRQQGSGPPARRADEGHILQEPAQPGLHPGLSARQADELKRFRLGAEGGFSYLLEDYGRRLRLKREKEYLYCICVRYFYVILINTCISMRFLESLFQLSEFWNTDSGIKAEEKNTFSMLRHSGVLRAGICFAGRRQE